MCLDGMLSGFRFLSGFGRAYFYTFIQFFSCLALNDLIRGRQADEIIDRLAEIWETLFRVLDDIKVRNKLAERFPIL